MKKLLLSSLAAFALVGAAEQKLGIVNFATCVSESKIGKQEQAAFEEVKKRMESLIGDVERQLQEVQGQLQDPDYMDGLSPEGEQELQAKNQTLLEEYQRYRMQFSQGMQQAQMQVMQKVLGHATTAADKVRKTQNLDMVVNREACLSFNEAHDVTTFVINEMDNAFDTAAKKSESSAK